MTLLVEIANSSLKQYYYNVKDCYKNMLDIVKVKKEWNDDILTDGGISYYKLNNKWYRVSVWLS